MSSKASFLDCWKQLQEILLLAQAAHTREIAQCQSAIQLLETKLETFVPPLTPLVVKDFRSKDSEAFQGAIEMGTSGQQKISVRMAMSKIKSTNTARQSREVQELRSEYCLSAEEMKRLEASRMKARSSKAGSFNFLHIVDAGEHAREHDWFMIHPESPFRISWNMGAFALLVYTLITVPLALLDPEPTLLLVMMEWINALYWTVDIGLSFITGNFTKSGAELEVRFRAVARKYVSTWFPFDLAVIIAEWVLMIVDTLSQSQTDSPIGLARTLRAARFLKVIRYMRLVRLLRVLKLQSVFDTWKEKINSDGLLMALTIFKWGLGISFLAHVSACLWYAAGNEPNGWVYTLKINESSLFEKYFTSFEWSLTRLHPTNLNRIAELRTTVEKMFSVAATFCALMISSLFVSLITNKMAEIKRNRHAKDHKLDLIRNYLQRFNISTCLALRLKRHVTTSYMAQLRAEEESDLMRILPTSLLQELRYQTWGPVLEDHQFFEMLGAQHKRVKVRLCHKAISEIMTFKDDTVFEAGDSCRHTFFPLSGAHSYQRPTSGDEVSQSIDVFRRPTYDDEIFVRYRECLCEAALWTKWEYRGSLLTKMSGGIAEVDSDAVAEIIIEHGPTLLDTVAYARQYLSRLNARVGELTDLPGTRLGRSASLAQDLVVEDDLRSAATENDDRPSD